MPVVTLENVKKKIDKRMIIDGINMSLNKGEVYGFIGPNGAGKTMTIRMMVGLIQPSEGTIRICGHDITKEREHAMAHIGCIVENPEVYSYLTGYQNLLHYARLAKIDHMKEQINYVIQLVNLEDRIHEKVKKYSLGMRQRLGIAQALLGNPQVLILDEPTNGLDPTGIKEFRHLIRKMADSGMAVFVSSHNLSELEQVCDRVGIVNKGKLITEQTMESLQSQKQQILLSVNPVSEAYAILKEQDYSVEQEEQTLLRVSVSRKEIPKIIRLLTKKEIDIYSVEPLKESLEEQYLKLTGDGIGGKADA